MKILHLKDLDLKDKRVLIRSDLNVPVDGKRIISDRRIRASLETIRAVVDSEAAKVIIASHLGRPEEGRHDSRFSLQLVANHLQKMIPMPVRLVRGYSESLTLPPDRVIVLENVRFNIGETDNSEILSRKYASMCDIFVMDAFGAAHRTHSSTYGVCRFVSLACSGFLLSSELENLGKLTKNPARPVLSIVGGSKVSTKIKLLRSLLNISDQMAVGGGIANTFLSALGFNTGRSIRESDCHQDVGSLMRCGKVLLPVDVKVEHEANGSRRLEEKLIGEVEEEDRILDIGRRSVEMVRGAIRKSNTIIWTGPVGMFETEGFEDGTREIAREISRGDSFSIAGGGDTIAAIDRFDTGRRFSYISTGGGAFLKFIEDGELPAVLALQRFADESHSVASDLRSHP